MGCVGRGNVGGGVGGMGGRGMGGWGKEEWYDKRVWRNWEGVWKSFRRKGGRR